MIPTKQADAWMREGIKCHEGFNAKFRQAKDAALNAGFFFLSARACFKDGEGEWTQFCAGYSAAIAPRTIRFYTLFASDAIEWAKKENPGMVGLAKLQTAAKALILQSPKGLVALCRQLGFMRKFGEYDEVKYRTRNLHDAQLELDFSKVIASFDALDHLGESNFSFLLPNGTNEEAALSELKSRLERALVKINTELDDRVKPLNAP